MADTYEQNLGQKSSLTTSDFIRVVGSDNVSYKQRVDKVMGDIGVYTWSKGYTNPQVSAFSELKDSGFYTIGSASSYSDAPVNTYGFLAVFHGGSYATQTYYAFGLPDHPTYFRFSTNNGTTWTAWTKEPTRTETDMLDSDLGTAISNETDLNTLVLPGNHKKIKIYRGEDITRITNGPSDVSSAWPFCLMLLPIGGSYTKQILHIYATADISDRVYIRTQTYKAGAIIWTNWQQSPTRAEIDALNTHAPTTSTLGTLDLNTLPLDKPMRIYLQNIGREATIERHYPAEQLAGFLLHFRASDWILQVYFGFGASKIYYRQWYDSQGTPPSWSTIS